ncbi:MAG: DUF1566 domain-containing protein [Nitrospinae bacterium]|nr:DUF1566 domain-containing protein [Nitrospinota bacterium]MBL7020405.1 DUF1566 domain-containing protein [Nitrospinaceae bacterium]
MPALSYFVSAIFLALFLSVVPVGAAGLVDNQNGSVTDSDTGLVWQKGDSFHELKKGLNWYEALEYVAIKNSEKFAGHDDWRLPNLNELNRLWVSSGKIKSKDRETLGLPLGFADGGSYYIWSGDERGLDHAWYFGLGNKENYFNLKDLADMEQGVKMVTGREASVQ